MHFKAVVNLYLFKVLQRKDERVALHVVGQSKFLVRKVLQLIWFLPNIPQQNTF